MLYKFITGFSIAMFLMVLFRRRFWPWFTCAVREFLGIPQLQERIFTWFERLDNRPVLACVTILCETAGDYGDESMKPEFTVCGAEAFISPGQKALIFVDPHRTVGRFTYFVSGHPNLVVTSFRVGNNESQSDDAGKKFGKWNGSCHVGNRMYVVVEYRTVEGGV